MRIATINRLVIQGYVILTLLTLAAILTGDHYLRLKDLAGQRREASLRLADQLLAGSKTLTNNVRAFAATGESRYRAAFREEMTVKRSRDKAVEGLRELEISNDESDLIEEAKAQSDQLIHLEERAFAAGEAGQLRLATELVYGPAYQQALDSIYGPIERFCERLRTRLARTVEQAEYRAWLAGWAARFMVGANMASVLAVFMLFYQRRVVRPLMTLEAALKRQLSGAEANLRAILDGMSEGIISLDPEGRTLFINPSACRLLGYTADELLGSPAHAKVHHSYPDGRPHPHEACPMYLTLLDGQARQVDEDVMWRKDGAPVRVAYRTTAMRDSRGQCTGSVIAFNPLDVQPLENVK